MNKFCANCGAKITEGADVCLNCGKSLKNNGQNPNISDTEKKANTGLILGLIGIIAWLLPLVGYPITICGIVFSSKGLKSNNKTKAVIGLVLSIIFLLVTLANSILGVLMNLDVI